jgi:hypothetical protein
MNKECTNNPEKPSKENKGKNGSEISRKRTCKGLCSVISFLVALVTGVILCVIAFFTGRIETKYLLKILENVWIIFGIAVPIFLTGCIISRWIGKAWKKICRKMKQSDTSESCKPKEVPQPEQYDSCLSIKTDFVFTNKQGRVDHHNEVHSNESSHAGSSEPSGSGNPDPAPDDPQDTPDNGTASSEGSDDSKDTPPNPPALPEDDTTK